MAVPVGCRRKGGVGGSSSWLLFPATPGGSACCGGGWSLASPGLGSRMHFSCTPGWGPLPVIVVGPLPLLAGGPGCGSSPLLAWVRQLRWWWLLVSLGLGQVFPCSVCLWRGRVCVVLVSSGVLCVCGAGVGGCVGDVALMCLRCALGCVHVCVWCVSGLLLLDPASFGWGLQLVFVLVWLVRVAGGPSPFLDEGPWCGSPPLLAGVRSGVLCRRWWVDPRHSWQTSLGAVPCHSWLGSAGYSGGWSLATPG